jgi:hypothetical protein
MDPHDPEGGCTCGAVRYRLLRRPLWVHCCHCRWCQRETGSAFALNALIEADAVQLLRGEPEFVDTPPDIHIYTASKQRWVQLGDGAPAVPAYYRRSAYWPPESVERYQKALGR